MTAPRHAMSGAPVTRYPQNALMARATRAYCITNAPDGAFLSDGERVIRFIEGYCVHTKGRWQGQPFKLLPWERVLLLWLFRLDPATRRRVYRRALVGIPKKNGKTELSAAIALYLLLADDETAPEVYCAANSDEQADLVFGAAKTMCQLSPKLGALVDVFDSEIHVRGRLNTQLVRLSGRAVTKDGINVHGLVFDEFHEAAPGQGEKLYDILSNGVAAREQPLALLITTAGYDLDGTRCGLMYQYGCKLATGELEDPSFLFVWFQADPRVAYPSPEYFESANPSYGATIQPHYFEDQLRDKSEGIVRRYNGNEWTQAEDIWIPAGAWDRCRVPHVELDPTLPAFVGIDASWSEDATAVVVAQRQGDRIVIASRIWERPVGPDGHPVVGWLVPMHEVKAHLRALDATLDVYEFGYDRKPFATHAAELDADGLLMVEFPQTAERMVPATQQLYSAIVNGVLAHDGDPALGRHVHAAVVYRVNRNDDGWRITKGRAKKKIDGAVALAIAVALLNASDSDGAGRVYTFDDEADDETDDDWSDADLDNGEDDEDDYA